MLSTRQIGTEDLASLTRLSVEFLEEVTLLDNAPLDINTLLGTLLNACTNPSWWGAIGFSGDEMAGMVIARRIGLFFSVKNVGCDCVFFVRKQFRGTLLIKKLVKDYTNWAFSDDNCVGAQLNAFAGQDNERGARLAEALGYPRVGFIAYKKRK